MWCQFTTSSWRVRIIYFIRRSLLYALNPPTNFLEHLYKFAKRQCASSRWPFLNFKLLRTMRRSRAWKISQFVKKKIQNSSSRSKNNQTGRTVFHFRFIVYHFWSKKSIICPQIRTRNEIRYSKIFSQIFLTLVLATLWQFLAIISRSRLICLEDFIGVKIGLRILFF